MVGTLTEGMSLQEALDNTSAFRMMASDGDVSSLGFRQLQADLSGRGFDARAAAPEGTRGTFNSVSAGLSQALVVPVSPAPAISPSYVQNSAMSMRNG